MEDALADDRDPPARAELLIEAGRRDEAVPLLEHHLATCPDDHVAHCLLATALLRGTDPDATRGLAAAEGAVRSDPDSPRAHHLRSFALQTVGRIAEARTAADTARRLAPDEWTTHVRRAEVDVAGGLVGPSTRAAALEAVRLAPDEPDAHLTLGTVHLADGDLRAAIGEYEHTLRLDPSHGGARNNLAVAAVRRRRLVPAGRHLRAALRADPLSELTRANLRLLLSRWMYIATVLGVLAALAILSTTKGRRARTYAPRDLLTIPAPAPDDPLGGHTTVPVPGSSPPLVAAAGHPAASTATAAALVGALVVVAALVRYSLGPGTGRLVLRQVRRDAGLMLVTAFSAAVLGPVLLATAVGLPLARTLAELALVPAAVLAALLYRATSRHRR